MTRIGITGAGGDVGRELLGAFADEHDVVPFTYADSADIDGEQLDVTDPGEVASAVAGLDVVVHLAGASSPDAAWAAVAETNVQGTKNVLDAAVESGLDRLVFASSNHAVGMHNAAGDDPERMTTDAARPVRPDAPIRPDSFYGVSKVACEGLTNFYADRHGLEVVNLRIGWYMTEDELAAAAGPDVEPGKERFARATWLSPHDCRDVHRTAALADLPESPVTVNAVSRNDDRFHSLTETMQTLGYEPRDNAAEMLDG